MDIGDMAALVSAVAALGAFVVGLWNAHQIGKVNVWIDGLEKAHLSHVNAPGLHAR